MKTTASIPDDAWLHADKIEQGIRMIRIAIKMYQPRKVWSLCSGGNDSLCATHLAMQTGLAHGVVSINTTIGIQECRDHLTAVAERFGWPLQWLFPPISYQQFCAKFGMPGPGRHDYAYAYLKERCVRQLVRESKQIRSDRVLLITGVRLSESSRRMGHVEAIRREGAQVWLAPIINWDNEDKTVYQINNGIPRNPVTPVLGMSGECLCGAFAKPGERDKIRQHYPNADAQIVQAQEAAARNCKPCAWGERPSKKRNLCQNCERKNGDSLTEAA